MLDLVIKSKERPFLVILNANLEYNPKETPLHEVFNPKRKKELKKAIKLYDKTLSTELKCTDLELCLALGTDRNDLPVFNDKIILAQDEELWSISLPYEIWSSRVNFAQGVVFIHEDAQLEDFVVEHSEYENILTRLKLLVSTEKSLLKDNQRQ